MDRSLDSEKAIHKSTRNNTNEANSSLTHSALRIASGGSERGIRESSSRQKTYDSLHAMCCLFWTQIGPQEVTVQSSLSNAHLYVLLFGQVILTSGGK